MAGKSPYQALDEGLAKLARTVHSKPDNMGRFMAALNVLEADIHANKAAGRTEITSPGIDKDPHVADSLIIRNMPPYLDQLAGGHDEALGFLRAAKGELGAAYGAAIARQRYNDRPIFEFRGGGFRIRIGDASEGVPKAETFALAPVLAEVGATHEFKSGLGPKVRDEGAGANLKLT